MVSGPTDYTLFTLSSIPNIYLHKFDEEQTTIIELVVETANAKE